MVKYDGEKNKKSWIKKVFEKSLARVFRDEEGDFYIHQVEVVVLKQLAKKYLLDYLGREGLGKICSSWEEFVYYERICLSRIEQVHYEITRFSPTMCIG